ncbi:hypothetical protein A1O3_09224 [Capronia epimyces CBS 606.96]|uniref:Uncharacterized protein n=1 Tax=Capronia epimyces CBS 606.96 TaxID=1182542 RepID=W9XCY3_9EURO|nr:uncharacterized protein A1O3_09224 [Capronia epimyces CBS 606.96]EXJ78063.1 hypothetical protein A1O3_09224 [Capronia epimyces CBS 606.96]
MFIRDLIASLCLLFINMVRLKTLYGLFTLACTIIRKVVRHTHQHGERDIVAAGQYTYLALLIFLTWALSRGTGHRIEIRRLFPQQLPVLAQVSRIWSRWKNRVVSTYSAWSRRLYQVLATAWKLFSFWKKTETVTVPPTGTVQQFLADCDQDASPDEEETTICLLCHESLYLKSPALYMCCNNVHRLHLRCASKVMTDEQPCSLCHDELFVVEQSEAEIAQSATKNRQKNKKQRRRR